MQKTNLQIPITACKHMGMRYEILLIFPCRDRTKYPIVSDAFLIPAILIRWENTILNRRITNSQNGQNVRRVSKTFQRELSKVGYLFILLAVKIRISSKVCA